MCCVRAHRAYGQRHDAVLRALAAHRGTIGRATIEGRAQHACAVDLHRMRAWVRLHRRRNGGDEARLAGRDHYLTAEVRVEPVISKDAIHLLGDPDCRMRELHQSTAARHRDFKGAVAELTQRANQLCEVLGRLDCGWCRQHRAAALLVAKALPPFGLAFHPAVSN